MSEISSDNLHHFTHSFEVLQSILLNGFYPHITEEDISFILEYIPNAKAGFPIVCFCDLPSNLLKIHKKRYGNYGLSLSKEWGIKNGINPVMYVSDKNAQVMNYYRNIQQFILNKNFTDFIDAHKDAYGKQAEEIMSEYFYNVLCMSAFLRRYEDENTRFYDEREWRYLFIDGKTSFIQQIYFTIQFGKLKIVKNLYILGVQEVQICLSLYYRKNYRLFQNHVLLNFLNSWSFLNIRILSRLMDWILP